MIKAIIFMNVGRIVINNYDNWRVWLFVGMLVLLVLLWRFILLKPLTSRFSESSSKTINVAGHVLITALLFASFFKLFGTQFIITNRARHSSTSNTPATPPASSQP